MPHWTIGQQVKGGKYIIEDILGIGGFGITYRAQDPKKGKTVAIKTLNHHSQCNVDFLKLQEKFVNEALKLAKCSHPNVVEVHYVFQEDRLWCMVMEYIDGEDLGNYVKEKGVLSEEQALAIVRQIGEALTYVHTKGLLHRDVKPQNIILHRNTGKAVLIDFGLARKYIPNEVVTQTNDRTLYYAPIEQFEKKGEFCASLDVYSLAATLYFLLTGKLPTPSIARKEGDIPLVLPKQHNPSIREPVNQAILKGMALEAKDRPQSVEEWLNLFSSPTPPIPIPPPKKKAFKFKFETIAVDASGKQIASRHREAKFFAEDLGNGIMLEMVYIPGGTFMMGSPETEIGQYSSETPQHPVTIAPFFMGRYPITQAQWKAVMGQKNPSHFPGDNLPVDFVSWYEAVEFCDRLAKKTGLPYRLPCEAEWEYTCRAGTHTPFYFGHTITSNVANYNGCTYTSEPLGKFRGATTPVGSFPPNAFGLYDMHGNVWEWCADPWHENYNGAPSDGKVWDSGAEDLYRIMRGGSWKTMPKNCRAARRCKVNPHDKWWFDGFRVALSLVRS